MNEDGQRLRVIKNESEYEKLARMLGRYKRMRTEELKEIKEARSQAGTPEQFIEWREIHALVW